MTLSRPSVRVAAVQMKMRWYEDAQDFGREIAARVRQAAAEGAELVVFPEDVGLPLLGLGDMGIARKCERADEFAAKIVLRHFPRFVWTMLHRRCSARRAALLLKARPLREAYMTAFSSAAKAHGVHIVGGSIPLPPADKRRGEVYNTSAVFGPDGECLGMARKVDLIPLEARALHLCAGTIAELPVFEAPFGKFAVVICADNWNGQLVADLYRRGAEIICNTAANPAKWTEAEQASHRNGLWARCQELPLYGIQASGIGHWLDLIFEGQSIVAAPSELTPDGSGYLATARTHDEEEIITAELDLQALRDLQARARNQAEGRD